VGTGEWLESGGNGQIRGKNKKIGAGTGDPNLRFQPRLPGSVVGEASMEQMGNGDKITKVTISW